MREFIYDLDITPIITQAREQFRIYCEMSKMGEGWFWDADNLIESFVLREMFLRVHLYSHHGDTHRRLRESAAEYACEADLLLDVDTQKISFLWDVLLRDAFLQVMMIKPENYDIKTMLIGGDGLCQFFANRMEERDFAMSAHELALESHLYIYQHQMVYDRAYDRVKKWFRDFQDRIEGCSGPITSPKDARLKFFRILATEFKLPMDKSRMEIEASQAVKQILTYLNNITRRLQYQLEDREFEVLDALGIELASFLHKSPMNSRSWFEYMEEKQPLLNIQQRLQKEYEYQNRQKRKPAEPLVREGDTVFDQLVTKSTSDFHIYGGELLSPQQIEKIEAIKGIGKVGIRVFQTLISNSNAKVKNEARAKLAGVSLATLKRKQAVLRCNSEVIKKILEM